MEADGQHDIGAIFRSSRMDAAMAAAYEDVLQRHERLGIALAVWENGTVVLRTAAEIRRLMDRPGGECPSGQVAPDD